MRTFINLFSHIGSPLILHILPFIAALLHTCLTSKLTIIASSTHVPRALYYQQKHCDLVSQILTGYARDILLARTTGKYRNCHTWFVRSSLFSPNAFSNACALTPEISVKSGTYTHWRLASDIPSQISYQISYNSDC